LYRFSCIFFLAENEEEWKIYQMWSVLPENVKKTWIEAGKTINAYEKLAKSIPDKVSVIFLSFWKHSICIC